MRWNGYFFNLIKKIFNILIFFILLIKDIIVIVITNIKDDDNYQVYQYHIKKPDRYKNINSSSIIYNK